MSLDRAVCALGGPRVLRAPLAGSVAKTLPQRTFQMKRWPARSTCAGASRYCAGSPVSRALNASRRSVSNGVVALPPYHSRQASARASVSERAATTARRAVSGWSTVQSVRGGSIVFAPARSAHLDVGAHCGFQRFERERRRDCKPAPALRQPAWRRALSCCARTMSSRCPAVRIHPSRLTTTYAPMVAAHTPCVVRWRDDHGAGEARGGGNGVAEHASSASWAGEELGERGTAPGEKSRCLAHDRTPGRLGPELRRFRVLRRRCDQARAVVVGAALERRRRGALVCAPDFGWLALCAHPSPLNAVV